MVESLFPSQTTYTCLFVYVSVRKFNIVKMYTKFAQ